MTTAQFRSVFSSLSPEKRKKIIAAMEAVLSKRRPT